MLARFERLMEQAIEGGLRRVFPISLEPVQLAKAAARAMERSRVVGVTGAQVANAYELLVAPADLERFGELRSQVHEDVRSYLTEYARERGLRPAADIRVQLIGDRQVKVGSVRAVSRYLGIAPARQNEVRQAVSATRKLQLEELAAAQAGRARQALPARLYLSPAGGPAFELDPRLEVVRLGRAIDNDVVVDSQRVSRYHTQLRWVDAGWLVYDLDSTNGTWLDGERISTSRPGLLEAGSRLRLGDVDLEVTRKSGPQARGRR
jgi:Protein of unknown function (DUF3662)/FHA domain